MKRIVGVVLFYGLLIAGAVCGAAIGELVTAGGPLFRATRVVLGMLAGLVLLFSSIWYFRA